MHNEETSTNVQWYYAVKEVDRKLSHSVVEPTSIICDIGGAFGMDTIELAKKCRFIINLDINKKYLTETKKISRMRGLTSKVDCIMASATHLPFKHETFCLITCFSVLDHLPNKMLVDKAICEFSRVIRKFGYVALTVPNNLFLIGTISMKIKMHTESTFKDFEQRFTPAELLQRLNLGGLTTIRYDAKFPTLIGSTILDWNFPKILKKIPYAIFLVMFGARLFAVIDKNKMFKLFGARMGYLSQKLP